MTAYHQERLTEPPAIAELRVEISYDGGETWAELAGEPVGDSAVTVRTRHPRSAAGERVWLRVSAADEQGNSVVQTKPELFRLT